jgi:spoIIIJ-associated protein
MAEVKKFSPMRWTAATEEAAVNGALQIVGVTRDDIDYDVLDRSEKGVTVRIKPRSAEAPAPTPAPEPAPDLEAISEEAPVALSVDEAGLPLVEEAPAEDEAAGEFYAESEEFGAAGAEDYQDEPADLELAEVEAVEAAVEAEPVAAPVVERPLDPEVAAHARSVAQDFLDRMGLEAIVSLGQGGSATSIPLTVEGADVGILIGKHGQTLQAFQYLLNLTLNNLVQTAQGEEGIRVVVDAGDYRRRRQNSLEQTAKAAAARARREHRSIRMDPMPAHERRLVHMALQGETDITTASEGRDPQRRVVITPAGVTARPSNPRGGNGGRGYGERSSSSFGDRGGFGERSDRGGDRNFTSDRSSSRRGMGGYGGPRRGFGGGR